ncbi:MAG: TonB-dependent receptor [Gammaproteobacteria bacterium]|nr:TonB-dependent receptor [Gammaproteobacteria bacterium]MDH3431937.1 TonB-dependent receptor [Gammaproteobacteria bacterium]
MLRTMMMIVFLLPAAVWAADSDTALYKGRPVAEVIDEFRAAGYPFAYSTNLVADELLVTTEPEATDPVDLVREILRPHGLTIRSEAGVHLVVRYDSAGLPSGNVLLVVTIKGGDLPVDPTSVATDPQLSLSTRLRPGIYEYSGVSPGVYYFDITAPGYEPARRIVEVWSGDTTLVSVGMDAAKPEIETIAVSASRYEILRDIAASRFSLDQRTIQNMPDIGEDPMRAAQRLPGASASGASAKTHFRGGEDDEIGIMLNGHGLFDPFHIRDYQSIFSAIDARAIEGVEVYTGGFPVRFGDRMSGLVLMESLESLQPRHTEIGLSVFNSSFLTAGNEADRRWLVSARRGNLDLVIAPEFGSPSYYDLFGEYSYDFSPDVTLSVNALFADDSVEVVLETEPAELERVVSSTRNAQLWIQLDNRWSGDLTSKLVLSAIKFDNRREGSLNDAEKIVAAVYDDREVDQFSFRQDWNWNSSNSHLMQWGIEVMYSDAQYDYANSAEYFGLPAMYEDQPESVSLVAAATPSGGSYALYFSDRWRISAKTILEWGLRWDDQTYTELSSDAQLSPRLNIMRSIGPKTELRLSWGRYHQSQGINELQIEDGITNFWPAQRADHLIAGIRHMFRDKYSLRIELFRKNMRQVRPRFENMFDPLGLIPEIQPDRVRLDPVSAVSKGVELSIDRSNGPMTWWASYTLSEATDRIDGVDEFRSWDQRHAFQGGINWTNGKWDVALAANIHSGWPTSDLTLVEDGVDDEGEPEFVAIIGPRNVERLGSFASVDFRVSRKWKLRRGSFMAFFEVSNLANRKNVCCRDWDFDEDEVTGEDVFEGDVDYWMPLLPAFGVLWEF